ncbi:MAG: tripartite tricarboxylate transporter substrate binding protein [Streptosporangiales bacterium]|nr:tripartite tricarboxylate transporter substrate binding protein [Streptosporangiales bacterium]
MKLRRFAAVASAGLLVAGLSACAQAAGGGKAADENWPRKGKPIEIIIAFDPGGPADSAARLVAPELEKKLGTSIQVVNKTGAGGQVGYTATARAKPDGYTFGGTGSPSVVVAPLDPARGAKFKRTDFRPLANQVIDPQVVAVRPDSPIKTPKDFVEAGKKDPGKIRVTTTGLQTGEHFAVADLERKTGAKYGLVHFSDGSAQAMTAFLGKHVDVYVGSASDLISQAEEGDLRPIGIMDTKRSPFFPDVPTFKEQGFDVNHTTIRGYSAPAGVPDAIAQKLEKALSEVLQDPKIVAMIKELGLEPRYMSGKDYEAYWAEQEKNYTSLLPITKEK